MMGAGKTTVGRLLGQRLGRTAVDSDHEIERWVGSSIPEIFEEQGEATFRAYEAKVIEELAKIEDLVISLGGGAVLADSNVAHFLLTGVLLYLDVPPETLVERLEDAAARRPLLAGDLGERVCELHARRDPRYRDVADAVIDANASPETVVDRILAWLREHRDVLTPSEFEAIIP